MGGWVLGGRLKGRGWVLGGRLIGGLGAEMRAVCCGECWLREV